MAPLSDARVDSRWAAASAARRSLGTSDRAQAKRTEGKHRHERRLGRRNDLEGAGLVQDFLSELERELPRAERRAEVHGDVDLESPANRPASAPGDFGRADRRALACGESNVARTRPGVEEVDREGSDLVLLDRLSFGKR